MQVLQNTARLMHHHPYTFGSIGACQSAKINKIDARSKDPRLPFGNCRSGAMANVMDIRLNVSSIYPEGQTRGGGR